MEPTPQARPIAKAHKSAIPVQTPIQVPKRQSAKRTYIRNGERYWIPNSSTRWTRHIPASKALDLISASAHAHTIGSPLNLAVTIHFERGKLNPLYRPQDAIGYWLKASNQWLALRGVSGTFIWVMEHVTGTGRHVHALVHCPPEHLKTFKKLGRTSWLKIAGMVTDDKDTIRMTRVGPRGYTVEQSAKSTQYLKQLKGSLRYHLKGIDPDQALPTQMGINRSVAELLEIEPEDNEPIYGRRTSQSQNISKGARDRYHSGNQQSDRALSNQ